ncbi:twin-arginine translocase TatA/TatE family subunit [Xylanimonas oleitrophica]|uniref:Sec-independent protein translocase protein TatA n=1 Tax=Xylanimonas oleitrophica TaxID=2607479 RepID=A0A2W5WNA4_9MICO|nr:Sec-independent protein translocase subunit TatA [Xylanimonas oleitrophica]PZR52817.1 twin-arginine translocase TatA/TatE family subunit [Xylanimonas oleitrophica]
MGMLRPWHILVLVIVILLLFGAKRLPDLARSVGQSLKIFKNEVKDLTDDGKRDGQDQTPGATSTPGGPTTTAPGTTTGTSPGGSAVPGLVDPDKPKA